MSKEFIINIIFLFGINLLIKPFYVLVIEVSVQNQVGPTDYGLYFALFNFSYIFQVLIDLGIQNYNSKTIAQNRTLAKSYIPQIIGLKLLLSILFIGAIFLGAVIMQYPKVYYHLLLLVAINQVLLSFILYLRTNISALGHYRVDSFFSALDKLILICLLGYVLWYSGMAESFTIYWFIYCQAASFLLCLTAILIFLALRVGRVIPAFSFTFSSELVRKTLPYALIILLMTVYTKVDAVMLERMLLDGKTEAGIYAAAYRLLDAVNMLGYLFAVLLLPMFSHAISKNESINELADLGITLVTLLSIGAALFCYFNGVEIMQVLYTESTPYYGNILKILIFGFIAIGSTYIFGTLLVAMGHIAILNIVFAVSILLNITLNYMFIPEHKAIAAAYTTVGTQAFVALAQIIIVHTYTQYRLSLALVIKLGFYVLVLIGSLYLLHTSTDLTIWVKLLCYVAIALLVSFLFKILDIGQLRKILFSNNINTFG